MVAEKDSRLPKATQYLSDKRITVIRATHIGRGWPPEDIRDEVREDAQCNDLCHLIADMETSILLGLTNKLVLLVMVVHKPGGSIKRLRRWLQKTRDSMWYVGMVWEINGCKIFWFRNS